MLRKRQIRAATVTYAARRSHKADRWARKTGSGTAPPAGSAGVVRARFTTCDILDERASGDRYISKHMVCRRSFLSLAGRHEVRVRRPECGVVQISVFAPVWALIGSRNHGCNISHVLPLFCSKISRDTYNETIAKVLALAKENPVSGASYERHFTILMLPTAQVH